MIQWSQGTHYEKKAYILKLEDLLEVTCVKNGTSFFKFSNYKILRLSDIHDHNLEGRVSILSKKKRGLFYDMSLRYVS